MTDKITSVAGLKKVVENMKVNMPMGPAYPYNAALQKVLVLIGEFEVSVREQLENKERVLAFLRVNQYGPLTSTAKKCCKDVIEELRRVLEGDKSSEAEAMRILKAKPFLDFDGEDEGGEG